MLKAKVQLLTPLFCLALHTAHWMRVENWPIKHTLMTFSSKKIRAAAPWLWRSSPCCYSLHLITMSPPPTSQCLSWCCCGWRNGGQCRAWNIVSTTLWNIVSTMSSVNSPPTLLNWPKSGSMSKDATSTSSPQLSFDFGFEIDFLTGIQSFFVRIWSFGHKWRWSDMRNIQSSNLLCRQTALSCSQSKVGNKPPEKWNSSEINGRLFNSCSEFLKEMFGPDDKIWGRYLRLSMAQGFVIFTKNNFAEDISLEWYFPMTPQPSPLPGGLPSPKSWRQDSRCSPNKWLFKHTTTLWLPPVYLRYIWTKFNLQCTPCVITSAQLHRISSTVIFETCCNV